jgi:hypothetical protein
MLLLLKSIFFQQLIVIFKLGQFHVIDRCGEIFHYGTYLMLLRCQVQLELTLMMCLGDRSTFTSTSALSGRHDRSSPLFLEDLLSSRGVCVFARVQTLSPPPPPHLFMVLGPGIG